LDEGVPSAPDHLLTGVVVGGQDVKDLDVAPIVEPAPADSGLEGEGGLADIMS
jgi:hypothetical protein